MSVKEIVILEKINHMIRDQKIRNQEIQNKYSKDQQDALSSRYGGRLNTWTARNDYSNTFTRINMRNAEKRTTDKRADEIIKFNKNKIKVLKSEITGNTRYDKNYLATMYNSASELSNAFSKSINEIVSDDVNFVKNTVVNHDFGNLVYDSDVDVISNYELANTYAVIDFNAKCKTCNFEKSISDIQKIIDSKVTIQEIRKDTKDDTKNDVVDEKVKTVSKFGGISILLLGGLGYLLYSSRGKN